jgi:hypothetical protein
MSAKPVPSEAQILRFPHRSPDGTFEPILKSVLEDQTLTPCEFRILLYLSSKPDKWIIVSKQIETALRWPPDRVRRALQGLRRGGYLTQEIQRDAATGQVRRSVSRLNRDKVVAAKTAGRAQEGGFPPGGKPPGWLPPASQAKSPGRAQEGVSPPGGKSPSIEKTERAREDGSLLLEEVARQRPGRDSAARVPAGAFPASPDESPGPVQVIRDGDEGRAIELEIPEHVRPYLIEFADLGISPTQDLIEFTDMVVKRRMAGAR